MEELTVSFVVQFSYFYSSARVVIFSLLFRPSYAMNMHEQIFAYFLGCLIPLSTICEHEQFLFALLFVSMSSFPCAIS